MDPVIHHASSTTTPDGLPASSFTRASTFRRDLWPSRTDVAKSVRKSGFYRTWDPRVVDLWIRYGVRDLPTAIYPEASLEGSEEGGEGGGGENEKPVTLTTTKHQEVFTFHRPNYQGQDASGKLIVIRKTHADVDVSTPNVHPFYRPEPPMVFAKLPHLRPSALYIFGGQSPLSSSEWRKGKMETTGIGVGGSGGVREGHVKEIVLEQIGHLVPMEAVNESAEKAADWFAAELEIWRNDEERWREHWKSKGKRERFTIDNEWIKNIGGDLRVKIKGKL